MLGNWPHVLGNGPHVLGNGPHVLGNGPHVLRNGPHVGIKTYKIMSHSGLCRSGLCHIWDYVAFGIQSFVIM